MNRIAWLHVFSWSLAGGLWLAAGEARSQEPRTPRAAASRPLSLGELTPTPEMWFYEQSMRNYQDPWYGVRRKAEYRAAQRQRRIAAQKWFGFSAARPTASPEPMYGSYSPHWGSNGADPWVWRGIGGTTVVLEPEGHHGHAAP
jgi:hypothetical protein